MKKIFLAIVVAIVVLTSCDQESFNEADFVVSITTVSLTVKGNALMEYDKYYHQLAWSEGKQQFRMMDDSLGTYFVVNLGRIPSEMGESLKAEVLYDLGEGVKSVSGTFNCSKIQTSSLGNYLWLWHEGSSTGALIQMVQ